jgi:hypothetical protein
MPSPKPGETIPDPVPVRWPDGTTGTYQPGRAGHDEPLLAPPPQAARRAACEVAHELWAAWTRSGGTEWAKLSPREPHEHATGKGTYTFTALHRGQPVVVVCVPVVEDPPAGDPPMDELAEHEI